MTYKYLGLNKYELTFKVYRDCNGGQAAFDGDPSAQGGFNRPFYFVVFDNQNGARVDSGSLTLKRKDTVRSAIESFCIQDADKLTCVEQGLYMDTITVPDGSKWYSIVHQRCCRNSGINNLQPLPGGGGGGSSYPGMTIYNIIPPSSSSPNNSADFKRFPPLFLCANQSFTFDHSATDLDGDVLKYYLVNPLDGGSPNAPQPNALQISNSRVNAAFQAPYNLSNIIGGTPNISIDENTGLLTCRPDAAGRFVVSVMVLSLIHI